MILGKMNIPNVGVGANALLTNLISCWEFSESSGSTLYDLHGSNNGSISGATINQAGLTEGKSYYFDGLNDVITVPYNSSLVAPNMTISCWFYPITWDIATFLDIIRKEYSYHMEYVRPYYEFRSGFKSSGTTYEDVFSTYPPSNQWLQAVMTYDGSTTKAYFNNSLINSTNASFTINDNASQALYFGNYSTGMGRWFRGYIDQIVMWSRALTAEEISVLYNSGSALAYSNFQ